MYLIWVTHAGFGDTKLFILYIISLGGGGEYSDINHATILTSGRVWMVQPKSNFCVYFFLLGLVRVSLEIGG